MKTKTLTIIAATALVVAVLAATPVGEAAGKFVLGNDSAGVTLTSTSGTSTTTTTATPAETADAFTKRLIGYQSKAQWGRTWDALHPAQKRFLSREQYTGCAAESVDYVPELVSIETVEVYDDPVDVKGVPQKSSKAVTSKVTFNSDEGQQSDTFTSRAVLVGDHWTWVMTDDELDDYEAGNCP